MEALPQTSTARVLAFSGLSFAFHLAFIGALPREPAARDAAKYQRVTVQVKEKEKAKKEIKEAPPPPKEVEKKKPEPPKEKPKVSSSKPKEVKPVENVQP